ncbi:bifunctional oligoribonuclease/PAP phosphatase NrnA [Candidatus Gracilibacteria bacterium]|nr:bifunctional oligoribonuclease/PAP phosphatase NrnA [Candidatus Gracilibacteria bacterium]
MRQEIQKLSEILKSSQKILLINHIRMDGDAWGSLAALGLILRKIGKEVKAINDCEVPPSLTFLGHTELIEPELDIKKYDPDIIISLDASDTSRLGKIYETWKDVFQKKPLGVIDHHISNPGFGDINIIDSNVSSTCELLVQVLEELGLTEYIDSEIATFLYLGLQTDTNMYYNSNVTSQTLMAGARLIEYGADYRCIITEMFQKKSFKQLKLWEILIANMKQERYGAINYSSLTKYDIAKLDIVKADIGSHLKGAINELLINIEGTQIAFLIYPISLEENKVSMRCQEGYDVASICESFGGGGHTQAAGFQSTKNQDTIIEELLIKIKEVL